MTYRTVLRRVLLSVISWIYLVSVAGAQTLSFPELTGRIVDEAGLLNAADRLVLNESLAGLEAKTSDQLVVVILKSLQGTSIEDYGYQLGRRWQVGQSNKNNGVLLIVAENERQVRIEVGYGVEGALTDAITRTIIETSLLPGFKAGDFGGGIKRGVEDIIQVLSGDAEEILRRAAQKLPPEVRQPPVDPPPWSVLVLALAGVGLLIFCALRGGAACRVVLQVLLLMLLSGRGRSSHGRSRWSGGGGTFGGGGSSGRW